jgi:hypothetical protein
MGAQIQTNPIKNRKPIKNKAKIAKNQIILEVFRYPFVETAEYDQNLD